MNLAALRCATLLVGSFLGVPAAAQTMPDQGSFEAMLLQDFERYDSICHGSPGDTERACGAADYIGYLLGQTGWCWGRQGEAYVEHLWHACEITSLRFSPPVEGWPGYGS